MGNKAVRKVKKGGIEPKFDDAIWPRKPVAQKPGQVTEMLARMWMACDPNRGGSDSEEIIGQRCTGGSGEQPVCEDTPLTGKPLWHWFIPRAEASLKYFEANGFKLT